MARLSGQPRPHARPTQGLVYPHNSWDDGRDQKVQHLGQEKQRTIAAEIADGRQNRCAHAVRRAVLSLQRRQATNLYCDKSQVETLDFAQRLADAQNDTSRCSRHRSMGRSRHQRPRYRQMFGRLRLCQTPHARHSTCHRHGLPARRGRHRQNMARGAPAQAKMAVTEKSRAQIVRT